MPEPDVGLGLSLAGFVAEMLSKLLKELKNLRNRGKLREEVFNALKPSLDKVKASYDELNGANRKLIDLISEVERDVSLQTSKKILLQVAGMFESSAKLLDVFEEFTKRAKDLCVDAGLMHDLERADKHLHGFLEPVIHMTH